MYSTDQAGGEIACSMMSHCITNALALQEPAIGSKHWGKKMLTSNPSDQGVGVNAAVHVLPRSMEEFTVNTKPQLSSNHLIKSFTVYRIQTSTNN